MKFLIINRPSGIPHGHANGANEIKAFSDNLARLKDEGVLEAAYTFVGGGSAYVVEASDTATLLQKVRGNPFYATSQTEVIPIMDSVDHYRNLADFKEAHASIGTGTF